MTFDLRCHFNPFPNNTVYCMACWTDITVENLVVLLIIGSQVALATEDNLLYFSFLVPYSVVLTSPCLKKWNQSNPTIRNNQVKKALLLLWQNKSCQANYLLLRRRFDWIWFGLIWFYFILCYFILFVSVKYLLLTLRCVTLEFIVQNNTQWRYQCLCVVLAQCYWISRSSTDCWVALYCRISRFGDPLYCNLVSNLTALHYIVLYDSWIWSLKVPRVSVATTPNSSQPKCTWPRRRTQR